MSSSPLLAPGATRLERAVQSVELLFKRALLLNEEGVLAVQLRKGGGAEGGRSV